MVKRGCVAKPALLCTKALPVNAGPAGPRIHRPCGSDHGIGGGRPDRPARRAAALLLERRRARAGGPSRPLFMFARTCRGCRQCRCWLGDHPSRDHDRSGRVWNGLRRRPAGGVGPGARTPGCRDIFLTDRHRCQRTRSDLGSLAPWC